MASMFNHAATLFDQSYNTQVIEPTCLDGNVRQVRHVWAEKSPRCTHRPKRKGPAVGVLLQFSDSLLNGLTYLTCLKPLRRKGFVFYLVFDLWANVRPSRLVAPGVSRLKPACRQQKRPLVADGSDKKEATYNPQSGREPNSLQSLGDFSDAVSMYGECTFAGGRAHRSVAGAAGFSGYLLRPIQPSPRSRVRFLARRQPTRASINQPEPMRAST
jgi:hypothetical protein